MKRILLPVILFFFCTSPIYAAYIDLPIAQFASYTNGLPAGNHTMNDSRLGLFSSGGYIFLFTLNYAQLSALPNGSKITEATLMTGKPLSYNNPLKLSSNQAYVYISDGPDAVTSATAQNPPVQYESLGIWGILFTQPSLLTGISPDTVTYVSSHNSTFYGGASQAGTELDPKMTFLRVTYTNSQTVYSADANGDGVTDETDYGIWLSNFGQTVTGGTAQGDFNGDGIVDGTDYAIWLKAI